MDAGPPDDPKIEDGRATLLCSSPGDAAAREPCADLLTPSDGDAADLLLISFTGTISDRLDTLRARGVDVDHSAAVILADQDAEAEAVDRTYAVESVETVDRLSDLGMTIRDVVAEWAYDGNPTLVCFDAVDDLIARAELEVVFEFLLVLIEGIRPWGAMAHFHFDPAAHDGETRRTLEPLFDDVVGYDA